jgi:hypothetical protein
MFKKNTLLFPLLLVSTIVHAQDDLLSILEKDAKAVKEPVIASFKGTRLINLHTIETLGKGSLDFRISHRFGDFSSNAYNFWGLDGPANIRLGLDYSLTDRFAFGIGRSSYGKMIDGFLKYRILRQTTDNAMPLSITGVAGMNITAERDATEAVTGINRYRYFPSRISYIFQLLMARKFNKNLTLQLSPVLIHYNLVTLTNDKNDLFAIALSGRYKVSKRTSITGEYIVRASHYTPVPDTYHNSASIGVDIETGGHVFQLFLSNSIAINEVQVIPYTSTSWNKGQIRIGFNISRVFALGGKRK